MSIKTSFEVPLSLLGESYLTHTDYNFVLVHHLENEQYRDFFLKNKKNRLTILDNSIMELGQSFEGDKFAQIVQDFKPDIYIIPDVFDSFSENLLSLQSFIQKYPDLPGKKMGVIHGKTFSDLVESYKAISELVDVIGIPFGSSGYLDIYNEKNGLPSSGKKALGRFILIKTLKDMNIWREDKEHHLLGANLALEFSFYVSKYKEGIISLDTSNPIAFGIEGKEFESPIGFDYKSSVKIEEYFDREFDEKQKRIIWKNASLFNKLIRE